MKCEISTLIWKSELRVSLALALSQVIREMSNSGYQGPKKRTIYSGNVKGARERVDLQLLRGGSAITISYSLEQTTTLRSCTCHGGLG